MDEESKKSDPPPPSLSKAPSAPPMPDLHRAGPPPGPQPTAGDPVKIREEVAEEEDDGQPELNHRLLAGLIDFVVASGVGFAVWMILPDSWIFAKLPWLAWGGYLITRDSLPFLGGQSIGKKAMKLKVETVDGKSIVGNWMAAVVRNVPMIVPFLPLVEAIVLMTREGKLDEGRRLGDEWARTRVVKVAVPEDGEEA